MKRRTLLSGLLASLFLAGFTDASTVSSARTLHNTLISLPRNQLQLWVVEQIRAGRLNKAQLIKALLSAGVSQIEPRPRWIQVPRCTDGGCGTKAVAKCRRGGQLDSFALER